MLFAALVLGWLLLAGAVVTQNYWLLVAAGPILVAVGAACLSSRSAWEGLARRALAAPVYGDGYRARVGGSDHLRLFMGCTLVVLGLGFLVAGLSR